MFSMQMERKVLVFYEQSKVEFTNKFISDTFQNWSLRVQLVQKQIPTISISFMLLWLCCVNIVGQGLKNEAERVVFIRLGISESEGRGRGLISIFGAKLPKLLGNVLFSRKFSQIFSSHHKE